MLNSFATLSFSHGRSKEKISIPVKAAVMAGWTGRDPVARDKHIAELEALGVQRPACTPIYYRVSVSRLTMADRIEAAGPNSSGEAEFVLIQDSRTLWVGLGSDHTDRKLETYNVTMSKQVCDKPIAPEVWAFDDVRDHWDSLVLRSWILEDGRQRVYQQGSVAALLPPEQIIRGFAHDGRLPDHTVMFCGTLAAEGGIRPSEQFVFELVDPVRERRIAHQYTIAALPVAG